MGHSDIEGEYRRLIQTSLLILDFVNDGSYLKLYSKLEKKELPVDHRKYLEGLTTHRYIESVIDFYIVEKKLRILLLFFYVSEIVVYFVT